MYQQLVSVQLSYCRGIKKTGQSWRRTANLPCSAGEHFPWKKKGLIFLQRSTGRFSRGVSASLGRGGRVGWRAKCFSDREAWSRGAEGGFISAAMPPPRPPATRRTHMHGDVAVPRVWVPVSPDCRLVHEMGSQPLDRRPSPALCLGSFLSIHHSFPFPFTQAKKRKEKNLLTTLPSLPSPLVPCPSMAPRENGHPTASSCSSSQSPVWGFVHLRKL